MAVFDGFREKMMGKHIGRISICLNFMANVFLKFGDTFL